MGEKAHVPAVPVLVAIGLVVLVLLFLLVARRRGGERDLIAPPRLGTPAPPPPPALQVEPHRAWPAGAAPVGDVPPALEGELRALLAAGRKLEAIKQLRAATSCSLSEAKEMVERM